MLTKVLGVYGFSIASGVLAIFSLHAWFEIRGEIPALETKRLPKEIVEIHHKVYEKVGEEVWEENVKPEFARVIAVKIIKDTGNVAPGVSDIAKWMEEHPEEARELLKKFSEEFKKPPPEEYETLRLYPK